MIKKFSLTGGGLIITLFLLFIILPSTVLAAEGECHLKHCLVPAPTVFLPEEGELVTSTRPAIIGLTWKTTIVKVYLDGQELTNVQMKKHEDYYASFYVVPDFDLSPGQHYVYTIAHSEKPGWYDQSKESIYIDFTVLAITPKPRPITTFEPQPKTGSPVVETETPEPAIELREPPAESPVEIITPKESEPEKVDVIDSTAFGEVEIKEGEIEGGVSIEKEAEVPVPTLQEAAGLSDLGELLEDEFKAKEFEERERQNRTIGLVMLAIILVVTIIWLTIERQQRIRKQIYSKDEGELPPPPTPPKEVSKEKSKKEKITIEPIKEEMIEEPFFENEEEIPFETEETEDRYWASPPSSPHSPYPSTIEADEQAESSETERQDDLGI